jgi:hypothetical protein
MNTVRASGVNLRFDSIAEGEYLKRSGSRIVGGTPSGGRRLLLHYHRQHLGRQSIGGRGPELRSHQGGGCMSQFMCHRLAWHVKTKGNTR